jgi:hypothetical protein
MLDKTIQEAYVMDVRITNRRNLCSTINKTFQMYTNLKEELTKIWKLNADCTIILLSIQGIIQNNLHDSLELTSLRPEVLGW